MCKTGSAGLPGLRIGSADEVHRAVNQTSGVAEAYVTFISPAGTYLELPEPGNYRRTLGILERS